MNNVNKKIKWGFFPVIFAGIFAAIIFYAYSHHFKTQKVIASFSPYNFTNQSIPDIYVNGTWAGSVMANSGGGSGVCCALIPKIWEKKLSIDVKWMKSDNTTWITKRIAIPKYESPASLQLIFFRDDEVKVYVMDYWPCSKEHPMPKKFCTIKADK